MRQKHETGEASISHRQTISNCIIIRRCLKAKGVNGQMLRRADQILIQIQNYVKLSIACCGVS